MENREIQQLFINKDKEGIKRLSDNLCGEIVIVNLLDFKKNKELWKNQKKPIA